MTAYERQVGAGLLSLVEADDEICFHGHARARGTAEHEVVLLASDISRAKRKVDHA